MPRKRKQQVKINNTASLEGMLQEVYSDACAQINDAQRTINTLNNSTSPEDVDDATKIAKATTDAQKIKDSAIKTKLELAKIQSDIIKHNGNIDEASQMRSANGAPSLDDFKQLRDWVKNGGDNEIED